MSPDDEYFETLAKVPADTEATGTESVQRGPGAAWFPSTCNYRDNVVDCCMMYAEFGQEFCTKHLGDVIVGALAGDATGIWPPSGDCE